MMLSCRGLPANRETRSARFDRVNEIERLRLFDGNLGGELPKEISVLLEVLNFLLVLLGFSSVENVPRLRRFPVDSSFFLEYNRYSPDFSFRIMPVVDAMQPARVA